MPSAVSSLVAPAFVIPHLAFTAFMDRRGFASRAENWSQLPRVPVQLPQADLFLRVVKVVEASDAHLALVVHRGTRPVALCQAEKVSNCVLAVMATSLNTPLDPRERVPVPVPASMWPAFELDVDQLMLQLGASGRFDSWFDPMRRSLVEAAQVGLDWQAATPPILRFFEDPRLLQSAMYFAASTSLFTFIGGDVERARANPSESPPSTLLQADAETAIWLAYKSVEALLGHLPSKSAKLDQRLIDEGFGDFEAGWHGEPAIELAKKLVSFTWDRDKRIAHGSHSPHRLKPVTYFEVMDYQYLAMALIQHRLFS